ncbi:MAG: SEC-C metal-binding domain-containing protein [Planctomycetota bacterium]
MLERLPKEDGKLAYDDWYPWWEEENSHPTPLAEGDQWIPLEDPLRRQHLNRVSWRMLANRISRQVDEYSSPETEAAEWNLDGFCDWFNKEFAAEANPISVADISGLSLGDIRARLAEHILWDKDPAIPAIEADAKDRKKGEMPEYGSKFSDQYGVTLDEGDLANIENLNPKKAPEHFRELYKDRCAHRREQQIGRGRIQEMERQLETFTSGWDLAGLCRWLTQSLRTQLGAADFVGKTRDEAEELIAAKLREDYTKREQVLGDEMMRFIEQYVLLDTIDNRWKDHLREMDYLRNAVAFSGMAQKDPKVEYKIRGLDNFRQMLILVEDNYSDKVMRVRLREEDSLDALGAKWGAGQARKDDAGSAAGGGAGGGGDATAGESRGQFAQAAERNQQGDGPVETIKNEVRRIGPNETCPCGSGRKYKKCHGLPGAGPLPPEVLKKLK